MTKIYTKRGDKGLTSLIGGASLSKSDIQIEAYGTIDELNSWIGLICDISLNGHKHFLQKIQKDLFVIGSSLASAEQSNINIPVLKEDDISLIENKINEMEEALPALKHFVLPGGHVNVSYVHISRTVCRRAERAVVRLNEAMKNDPSIIKYLNRLSDFLFVLARKTGKELQVEELKWLP